MTAEDRHDKLLLGLRQEKAMKTDARTMTGKDKKNKGVVEEIHKRKLDDEQEYEVHLQTERERRKKMDMFNELQALIPDIAEKAGKSTIVEEATEYIKNLEETAKKLDAKRKERKARFLKSGLTLQSRATSRSRVEFVANYVSSNSCTNVSLPSLSCPAIFHTWTSSNVTLSISGNNAHLSICSPKKPRSFSSLCFILKKHGIEVVTASLFSCAGKDLLNFLLAPKQASGSSSNQASVEVPAEETYKLATEEIILWITS